MMTRGIRSIVLVLLVGGVTIAAQQSAPSYPTPKGSPTVNGLAGFAKILCSAVFVSGRDDKEAARNSAYFFMPRAEQDGVTWTIDRDQRVVTASFGTDARSARLYGDQGTVLTPRPCRPAWIRRCCPKRSMRRLPIPQD
jgi:hypothetical protein